MIFKSKMIFDPRTATRSLSSGRTYTLGNAAGLTVGLTFHTTKRWDCQTYDFYCNQFDEFRFRDDGPGLDEEEMEYRYQAKLAHAGCTRKHVSYPGYMYWTGPKRRYEFRYAGATHPRYSWWKPFSVRKHGMYVRWIDNGPVSPSNAPSKEQLENPIWKEHRKKFADAMNSARDQMNEYEQKRGVIS